MPALASYPSQALILLFLNPALPHAWDPLLAPSNPSTGQQNPPVTRRTAAKGVAPLPAAAGGRFKQTGFPLDQDAGGKHPHPLQPEHDGNGGEEVGMGTSRRSAIAETTRGMNFHLSQETGATGWSRATRRSPWRLRRRMEGFRASEPTAGRGSVRGSEPGLLQNGRIWDAKSSQLLQPS